MSSESDNFGSQRRDFHRATRIPSRSAHAPPTPAVSNPSSSRPTQPPTAAAANQGPSRPSQPQSHGEGGKNTYRSMIRSLELQAQDLREHYALLKSLLEKKNVFDKPEPEVTRWEFVKIHMAPIAKHLMLGLNPRKNRPFPREEHIKEAILETFSTSISDTVTRKTFDRIWVESLGTKVKRVISDQRGRFSSMARTHLWRFLGVPKPVQGTAEEIAQWKQTLIPYARGNRWRWNGNDPFGSDALCSTIAFVKFGRRYSLDEPLKLTAKQLAWFVYVLSLAMDGDRNMNESEVRLHRKGINRMKQFILESRHLLTRIEIVVSEDVDTQQEVLEDNIDDD